MTWMTRQELLRYIRSPGVGKLLELARVREQHREAGEPLPDLFEQERLRVQNLIRGNMRATIYQVVRDALLERGWRIDPNAREDFVGTLKEFLHPKTGRPHTWIEAIEAQDQLDMEAGF